VTAGVDLIVRGGQVVTASDVVETAVAIKGGRVVALGAEAHLPPADRVIDASGRYVLPGLIDCHLHIGPEYDDWKTAPLAAARTGLTTLLPFVVYDEGETLPQAVVRLREEARAQSVLDFGFHFILNHEPAILDGIPEAVRLGVTSFKLFMTYKKRGKRMVSDEFIAKTMERLGPLGGLCQLHCENGDVLCYLEDKAIAEGRTAPADFPATCPDWTEEEAINRAILIGRMTGCPVYVVHLSTKVGLERIVRAASLPESRVLEDALCLVFLQHQFADLAARTAEDKVINALRKSWNKMTPAAQAEALKLSFGPREQALLNQALAS